MTLDWLLLMPGIQQIRIGQIHLPQPLSCVLPWKFLVFFVEKVLSFGESRQDSRVFKTRICRLSFSRPRHKRKTTTLSCYEDAGLHVRSTIKHEIFIYIFIHYNSYIRHTHINTNKYTQLHTVISTVETF